MRPPSVRRDVPNPDARASDAAGRAPSTPEIRLMRGCGGHCGRARNIPVFPQELIDCGPNPRIEAAVETWRWKRETAAASHSSKTQTGADHVDPNLVGAAVGLRARGRISHAERRVHVERQ